MSFFGGNKNLHFVTTARDKCFLTLSKDYISDCLKKYGFFSPAEIFYLEKLIDEHDNVIEIGTNIGSHAIYLADKNKRGKYFCFEPQLEIYKVLVANSLINNCINLIPYNYGISDKEEIVYYKSDVYDDTNTGAFAIPQSNGNKTDSFLKLKRLDQFHEIMNLDSIKLIKIDVEGMEVKVIYSIVNIINKYKPILFIEYMNSTFAPLCTILLQLNYRLFYFNTDTNQYFNYEHTLSSKLCDVNIVAFPNGLYSDKYMGLIEINKNDTYIKYDCRINIKDLIK
jgi:FkbM family methyltransferase